MSGLNVSKAALKQITLDLDEGVLTITLNRPEKLNGWTMPMMDAFKEAFQRANESDDVKALILTGSGRYYSAGVNLGGIFKPMHPRKLRNMIEQHNKQLFDAFLTCEKPILIAINGPAIGASVTSATLCNGIIAAESATFSTPFAALGIPPEGCSSIHFARLMGETAAQRMLGSEGWRPTAKEALEAGLVQWVAPDDQLLEQAQTIAKEWVAKGETRRFLGNSELEELKRVNAKESADLANAFLSSKFLRGQGKFLWSKKKRVPAAVFLSLWVARPLWGRLI